MKAITGRSPKGQPAHLEGFELYVQKLGNIPELPQNILRKAWGRSFKSYVIRKGEGRVCGTLWEITPEERKHIINWELIPEGWYKDANVIAILEDGKRIHAVTEIIENQPIGRFVDGSHYDAYLMAPEQMWKLAESCRT